MVAAAAGLWGRFSVFFRNAEQIERAVALVIGLVFWNERPGLIALLGVLIVLGAAFRVLRQSSPVA